MYTIFIASPHSFINIDMGLPCVGHPGIVWKRLNISSKFFHHLIAQSI